MIGVRKSFKIKEAPSVQRYKEIDELIERLRIDYPGAILYAKALHECTESYDKKVVHGRIVHINDGNDMVIHDNPWKDADFTYYAIGGYSDTTLVTKEYLEQFDKKEFLWIRHDDIIEIEVEYMPTSNKEAAKLLMRVEDL